MSLIFWGRSLFKLAGRSFLILDDRRFFKFGGNRSLIFRSKLFKFTGRMSLIFGAGNFYRCENLRRRRYLPQ